MNIIDVAKAIKFYQDNVGKKTYNMTAPRFDCSSTLCNALIAGGATNKGELSTVTMPAWLKENGYQVVYEGATTGATAVKYGDVPLMYVTTVEASGGSNGHTGLIGNNDTFWNTTATRFSDGALFVQGQAVQSPKWSDYIKYTRMKKTQIWRQVTTSTSKPASPAFNLKIDGIWGSDTWKGIQTMLAYIGHNLGASGIDGVGGTITVKALQSALNAKLKLTGNAKLVVDGILGVATIKALQKLFGTPQDGFVSKPTSQMVWKMQEAIKAGKVWL
ncbi:peptidoglycan amidohydrolase family protein [Lactococcus sp.]|uniref:peptidoglycan amidohydrolase family protein n=1 Tax=Lactococcus sp. TaxID=44273 RepID=UPI0035B0DF8C